MNIATLNRPRILLFVFALLTISYLIFTSAASAQNSNQNLDVTVSPPVFDLTALPGDTVKHSFRVRNNGTTPLQLSVQARKLISDPQSGEPTPQTSADGEELSWVTLDPSSFTAPPKEWVTVNFTINIPSTAAYGYYYVFALSQKGATIQKTTGAAVKGEVLVVTLLNVKKEGAISKAELVNFSPLTFVNQYLPVTFNVVLKNPGNVHVKPHGNIFITRGGGKDIGILDVNSVSGSILPGGKRTFEASWNDGFIVNEPVMEGGTAKIGSGGKPETHLAINWNNLTHFRVGPYTARLLLVYDDGTRDQTIEGTATFWVIPYVPIAIIVVGLLVIFFIIRTILGSYVRSQIKKSR